MIPLSARDIERFLSKVDQRGPDDCWPWLAYRDINGYGKLNIAGNIQIAPRVAFQLANGHLPPMVCHHCDNPPCCNPSHLFGGTQLDNMTDALAKGRSGAGKAQRVKTKCPQGHPYNAANTTTKVSRDGQVRRACRACARAYYHRTKGATA